MHEEPWCPEKFCGSARLFPLPNVVLFPHVIQPFHIFEPRYRQMTADALAGDRLIAPVLLLPGWESNYEGRPPVHDILCIGRIVAEQRLPDGRYNLLVRGLNRAKIVGEQPPDEPYRSAQVKLAPPEKPLADNLARKLRRRIDKVVRPWFPSQGPAQEQLEKLLQSDLSLGVLCDLLSFAVPLAVEAKQQLLSVWLVESRAQLLIQLLEASEPVQAKTPAAERKFPPAFSQN